MGATNQIKETNLSLQLTDKQCPNCQQTFTQEEIDDRNYEVWFDTTNDVSLIPLDELKDTTYYFPFGRSGYQFTIWIRSIEHQNCPATTTCQACASRYLTKQMKEYEGHAYCQACYVHLIKSKEAKC